MPRAARHRSLDLKSLTEKAGQFAMLAERIEALVQKKAQNSARIYDGLVWTAERMLDTMRAALARVEDAVHDAEHAALGPLLSSLPRELLSRLLSPGQPCCQVESAQARQACAALRSLHDGRVRGFATPTTRPAGRVIVGLPALDRLTVQASQGRRMTTPDVKACAMMAWRARRGERARDLVLRFDDVDGDFDWTADEGTDFDDEDELWTDERAEEQDRLEDDQATEAERLAPALAQLSGLRSVALAYAGKRGFGSVHALRALAPALAALAGLEQLDIGGLGVGAKGFCALAVALSTLGRLQRLNLERNGLCTEAHSCTKALAKVLPALRELRELNLAGNALGSRGAEILAPALKKLHLMRKLHLDSNALGVAGAAALSRALNIEQHMPALEHLGLRDNNFGGAGVAALAPLLRRTTTEMTCVVEME